jgi:hypothetical protein
MAAAPAEPNGSSIEALFRPSTRLRDSYRIRLGGLLETLTEVELMPHLTALDILATGVTWDEFLIFLRSKIVWTTPDVYVCNTYMPGISHQLLLRLGANASTGTNCLLVYVTPGTAAAVVTATSDFLLRFFATCEQDDLRIDGFDDSVSPISSAGLSLFFQESRDSLQKFTLNRMVLSEDLCLALATMSRLDVEVELWVCSLSSDAAGAFVECLQSDRGPVELHLCKIDSQILANALTGGSRVTRFKLASGWTDDGEPAVLFRALANNRGLVDLDVHGDPISDENWMILCESLQAHLTVTSLNLIDTSPWSPGGVKIILSDEQTTRRTRLLAEMMQTNTVLHTIELLASERNNQIYTEELRPYLVTNLYRPRVLAIKKTKDRPFREKVLGRAVHSVRSNPDLVWMFLSENVDAFVRSEEEEEESNGEMQVAVAAVVVAVSVAGSKRKR